MANAECHFHVLISMLSLGSFKAKCNFHVLMFTLSLGSFVSQVRIDILTPQNITVKRFDVEPEAGFVTKSYEFPDRPAFGDWSVVAYYGYEVSPGKDRSSIVRIF